jgi:hypothetical protein
MYVGIQHAPEMPSGVFGGNVQITPRKVSGYINYNCSVAVAVLRKVWTITACVNLVRYTGVWWGC